MAPGRPSVVLRHAAQASGSRAVALGAGGERRQGGCGGACSGLAVSALPLGRQALGTWVLGGKNGEVTVLGI